MLLQIINTAAAFGAGVCTLRIVQLWRERVQLKREIAEDKAHKLDLEHRLQQVHDDAEGDEAFWEEMTNSPPALEV